MVCNSMEWLRLRILNAESRKEVDNNVPFRKSKKLL